jgi:integrase
LGTGKVLEKKVAGKQLYFKTSNTAAGYETALTEWAKSQESPEPADPDHHRPFLRRIVEWYEQNGDPENRVKALRQFLDAKYRPAEKEFLLLLRSATASAPEHLAILLGETYAKDELANRRLWKERLEQPLKKKGLPIHDGIKRFLADQLQKVKVGKRRPSTYGAWVDRLKHAQRRVSGLVESINSDTLSNYYKVLTNDNKLGGERQKNVFKAFKSFVRWAWQEELLDELPRNINKAFEFSDDAKGHAWMLYKPSEIKSMMEKLPVRGRAAVMLGLNCGFTVGDVADLKKSNVDLTAGRVVYKRVKTRGRKHTPTINYKLWPETIAVLKEYQSDHPELWFLTEDGLPLKESKIVDDRESKWSALAQQWESWKESGDVPKKPQKGLRKTGATAIEATYPGWEQMFLGHAPTSIAGKHYVVKDGQPNPEFDRIMDWLREQVLFMNPPRGKSKTGSEKRRQSTAVT